MKHKKIKKIDPHDEKMLKKIIIMIRRIKNLQHLTKIKKRDTISL